VTWFMYTGSHYMNPRHEDYSPWLHPQYFYPGDDTSTGWGECVFHRSWPFQTSTAGTAVRRRGIGAGYAAWGR
jgi:hypothetical protein